MDSRPITNYLWLPIVAIALLSGCSSAPKVEARKPQYCHTSQTIVTENKETVNSRTEVDCTDDQIKRVTVNRLGIAPNCGEFVYWMQIGGRDVQRKAISCQKPNGTWEVINTSM